MHVVRKTSREVLYHMRTTIRILLRQLAQKRNCKVRVYKRPPIEREQVRSSVKTQGPRK